MRQNPISTQDADSKEPYHVRMARQFPTIYRMPSQAELEAAIAVTRKPIEGMLFSIGQTVRRSVTGQEGTVENCSQYPDGRFKYVVAWHNGDRQWVWESSIRSVESAR